MTIEIDTVYNIDCLELMREMVRQGIKADWCITDPPYGIGADKDLRANTQYGQALAKSKQYGKKEWDTRRIAKEYFDLIREVSKEQIIFGGNYYTDFLPPSSCWIVWDKENGDNGYADCELAWSSYKGAVRICRYKWQGMLQGDMKNKETRIHPTQKPRPVIDWLLNKYTKEGDLILDPFMGSFTTAVCCHKMQRHFIGAELDKDYFALGYERYRKETAQMSIFDLER